MAPAPALAPTSAEPGAPVAAVPSVGLGWWLAAASAVLVRPALWGTAVAQLLRLAPPRWWRRRPPLPLPDPSYLRFRLVTAYGGDGAAPHPDDVVTYLHWCRSWPRVTRA